MEKKISEFQDISTVQLTSDDFWIYFQSIDGTQDYRVRKSILIDIISMSGTAPTSEKGIVAHPTGGQADAVEMSKQYKRVDTVDNADDSVKPALPAVVGFQQLVQNKGSEDLEYFPRSGDNFLGQAADLPVTIAPGNQISVFCYEDKELTLI